MAPNEPGQPRHLPSLDRRIPAWDAGALRERRCPFCRSHGDVEFRRPDTLVVRRCAACDCHFVSPAPSNDELSLFYQRYAQSHATWPPLNERTAGSVLASDPDSDYRIRRMAAVLNVSGKSVLDVGFGLGETLVCFRKLGAKVCGVDLDPTVVAFARDRLGLDVHHGTVEQIPGNRTFDLITLMDVIEHPLEPLTLMADAANRLNPGGLIAFWTPNATFVAHDEQPVLFRVDLEHMQYLSTRTCTHLAKVLGMNVMHLESMGFPQLSGRANSAMIPRTSPTRAFIKTLPGVRYVASLKRELGAATDHTGRFHLFCILERPR